MNEHTGDTLEEKLAADAHRPGYHFLPPSAWMNDPNGLIHWRGRYHLFYQYNPHGPFHGTIHWGHAVSEDLVYWTDLPVALMPTPGGPDEDGCWSGCAVDHDGTPTLIYTGARGDEQLPCIATTTDPDLLTTWKKYDANPVISSPPPGLDVVAFRDHCAWKEDDAWYQVIGSGIKDTGGAALLYRATESLTRWEYLHPLYVGDGSWPVWTGSMWECPEFFPLGDKHVLVVSVYDAGRLHYTVYFTGTYEDHRFTPEHQGVVDHGGHFYAPQSMFDEEGRRIMWGWLREERGEETVLDSGWAGMMSLPRVLSLNPDGSLGAESVPELESLRGRHHRFENVEVSPGTSGILEGVRGSRLEILAEFEPGSAEEFGLKVARSPDGAEETLIVCDRKAGRLRVDRSRSGGDTRPEDGDDAPLGVPDKRPLKLRVFLDGCVVEVFPEDGAPLTALIYPSRPDSTGLDLFCRGGKAELRSLDVWEMDSIWQKNRPAIRP
jgi:beta-fructofuranosidase